MADSADEEMRQSLAQHAEDASQRRVVAKREHKRNPTLRELREFVLHSAGTQAYLAFKSEVLANPLGSAGTLAKGPEAPPKPGPLGLLGGTALADALGVHPERRDAFFKRLERKRPTLGDGCCLPDPNPRPHAPKYLYHAGSPEIRELAAAYKTPKTA
jgi:hypothetical protein